MDLLAERPLALARGNAIVRVQVALRLSDITEVLAHISLLKMRADRCRNSQARGPDALLVIEVSDTTLRKDMDVKTSLYARRGVPELWIVDPGNNWIHHPAPKGDRYGDVTSAAEPGSTPVPGLAGAQMDPAALSPFKYLI
ncbi:MAG: Uma2 family endonuclease [Steroidobacteraceae bacterium]